MKKVILAIMTVTLVLGIIGCASFVHTQAVRNETGQTVTEVYIRDTGASSWGSIRNVRARTDSQGNVIYRQDGRTVAYWDTLNMNDATQIVFFRESGSSQTPKEMRNQDIMVKDSNGIIYAKFNVPIIFSTTKNTSFLMFGSSDTTTSSDPITFTVQDRLPGINIVNQTGHNTAITAPVEGTLNNEGRFFWQNTEQRPDITVTYRIGQIEFTEQITMNNEDATVTLTRRPPTVTVVNQTGREITINSPASTRINNGARTQFLPPVLTGNIDIIYSSGLMRLTEQVTMQNQDVTVNLTAGAPTLTIVNNTGTGNNVNIIQFRTPGSNAWIGGNIAIRNNELQLTDGTAQTGVTTQVLTNGERLSLWLGTLNLSGNAFDIRLQTPSGMIFQRDNVRITSDMTLTFTSNDRR